jgi:2-polyprenyl-3-methyl-5-hydroxy-6-metoxy-1,4-benzoquinol methylase
MKKVVYVCLLVLLVTFSPKIAKKVSKIRKHFTVHQHGYWIDAKAKHYFDSSLAESILEVFSREGVSSCVDFGCGAQGYYVHFLREHGIACEGYDGNPYSPKLSKGVVQVLDLSQPFHLQKSFDWVISLEVGEHIPSQYETFFIENLQRHSKKGIILSWAVEGQKGRGHVNCRNNAYIEKVLQKYGYEKDPDMQRFLRKRTHLGWLKHTLMVFRRKE